MRSLLCLTLLLAAAQGGFVFVGLTGNSLATFNPTNGTYTKSSTSVSLGWISASALNTQTHTYVLAVGDGQGDPSTVLSFSSVTLQPQGQTRFAGASILHLQFAASTGALLALVNLTDGSGLAFVRLSLDSGDMAILETFPLDSTAWWVVGGTFDPAANTYSVVIQTSALPFPSPGQSLQMLAVFSLQDSTALLRPMTSAMMLTTFIANYPAVGDTTHRLLWGVPTGGLLAVMALQDDGKGYTVVRLNQNYPEPRYYGIDQAFTYFFSYPSGCLPTTQSACAAQLAVMSPVPSKPSSYREIPQIATYSDQEHVWLLQPDWQ